MEALNDEISAWNYMVVMAQRVQREGKELPPAVYDRIISVCVTERTNALQRKADVLECLNKR